MIQVIIFVYFSIRLKIVMFALVNFTVLMYFVTQKRRIEYDFKQHITQMNQPCHPTIEYSQNITRMYLRASVTNTPVSPNEEEHIKDDILEPVIYVITPTYRRGTQQPDLTRLAQTLMNVKRLHWIVVEDSFRKSKFVADLLKRSGLDHTHLNVATPRQERKKQVKCLAVRL